MRKHIQHQCERRRILWENMNLQEAVLIFMFHAIGCEAVYIASFVQLFER